MKNKKLKIKNLAIFLITILALSLFISSIFIVQAKEPSIGKFLTINFIGDGIINSDCNVTATKQSSEQIFEFCANPENGVSEHRMAAGSVLLTPMPADGWVFVDFGTLPLNPDGTAYYQTEKYGEVTARFTKEQYTIITSYTSGGSITPYDPDGDMLYGSNETPKFEFHPDTGHHLTSVIIDAGTSDQYYATLVTTGSPVTGFTTSYTFPPLNSSHTIYAVFSPDGQAPIEGGNNVVVFLSSGVSLDFPEVSSGMAYGNSMTPVIEGDLIVWNITVEADFAEEGVELAFQFDLNSIPSEILVCHDPNFELFLRCDLNNDGKVDGNDVSIISNIVKHPKFLEDLNPEDFNKYNLYVSEDPQVIDENDVHVVNTLNGMDYLDFQWELLKFIRVDVANYVIYGTTIGFSIFRCR